MIVYIILLIIFPLMVVFSIAGVVLFILMIVKNRKKEV